MIRISEFLYPRHCPFCDEVLGRDEDFLCRNCAGKLRFIRGPVCMRCGRPLEGEGGEYCGNCRKYSHLFSGGFAPFVYRGMIQNSILRFKYGSRPDYARLYARAAVTYGRDRLQRWKPEAIIPVPVHPLRYLSRGYNQAELFADCLSGELGIPVLSSGVYRKRNTRPQKGLKPEERRLNLKDAFGCEEGVVFPSSVLVVDDIYTTGATMDKMAEAVRKRGAADVWFACMSIAPGEA